MAAGYVDTNGVRLWYEELGRPDGAPALLVMGRGASVVWWPPELIQGLGRWAEWSPRPLPCSIPIACAP